MVKLQRDRMPDHDVLARPPTRIPLIVDAEAMVRKREARRRSQLTWIAVLLASILLPIIYLILNGTFSTAVLGLTPRNAYHVPATPSSD